MLYNRFSQSLLPFKESSIYTIDTILYEDPKGFIEILGHILVSPPR